MGNNNVLKQDFKVPVPFIPEVEKEADELDGKPPSIKLLLDADGEAIDNPTTQVQPIFNQGTIEQFFKWNKMFLSIVQGQSVTEKYRLALQSLRGVGKVLRQRELDIAGPLFTAASGTIPDAAADSWYASIVNLALRVLEDTREGMKHKRYMECHLFMGKQTGVRNFMDIIDILSNYLPLFPPIRNELMSELTDPEKQQYFMMH
jgi:hypothetical protein